MSTPSSTTQQPEFKEGTESLDHRFQEISQLNSLSRLNFFSLLYLPSKLEQAFREDYENKATATVRYSVYGLTALYFLVVLPIALIISDPSKVAWLMYAVYPIGIALLLIWMTTQVAKLKSYAVFSLRFGVFFSLSGTIYGTITLHHTLLGQVAGCETIYVLIVAYSLLMLRTMAVLVSAGAAFLVAALAAYVTQTAIPWISMFLYFFVPLLICSITGYLLEHAARRDFIQNLMQQLDKLRVGNDIAALINDMDEIDAVLAMALGRVCAHTRWIAGRVLTLEDVDHHLSAHYIDNNIPHETLLQIEQIWRLPIPSWAYQVATTGHAQWHNWSDSSAGHSVDHVHSPQLQLVFPVKLDNQVLALLEFFSMSQEQPDERLMSIMDNIGHQLSRIFERKRQQQDQKIKALHDVLTNLPNRAYLFDRLHANIARTQRDPGFGFCVFVINVDHFKWINDSLGHLMGDRLLIELSKRLQRASDFVARIGGDEFAIMIEAIEGETQAIAAMERILRQLGHTFTLNDHDIHLSLSIGIALNASHYKEPQELLRDAGIAMYHAKQSGRGTYTIFSHEMHIQAVGRLKTVAELRQAIKAQQFVLYYQPIVDMNNGTLAGFEALIRWQHPERGLLFPNDFIPLAEETGLIVDLTVWALKQACEQLRVWQQQLGYLETTISVNLCASYLTQADMPDQILAVIQAVDIIPSTLHLEITESQIVSNADMCMTNINRLREAQIEVYIDDFGTGYSSLNYLANFKVNTLKIDKSFLEKLCENGNETHIVRVITSLSHHLGMTVIAEGVETAEQLHLLKEIGCDFAQGYFFSKAVPVDIAEQMIATKFDIHNLDTAHLERRLN